MKNPLNYEIERVRYFKKALTRQIRLGLRRMTLKTILHFCLEKSNRLCRLLDEYQVSYSVVDFDPLGKHRNWMVVFDICKETEGFKAFRRSFPIASLSDGGIKYVFSEQEMTEAEWFTLHSITQKINYIGVEPYFKRMCHYRYFGQQGYMHIEGSVRWSSRQFFCRSNSRDDFLFCPERTKQLIEGKWDGIEFLPVIRENSGKEVKDLYQIKVTNRLPLEAFYIDKDQKLKKCPRCGRPLIVEQQDCQIKLKKDYLTDHSSFYTTGEYLTMGGMLKYTIPYRVVPKEFYAFCKTNKLDKGLEFLPVILL